MNYDLWLRYEGTDFVDLTLFPSDYAEDGSVTTIDLHGADATSNFKPVFFGDLYAGDLIRFVATVVYPDDPDEWVSYYDNGGTAPICSIGPVSCTGTTFTHQDNDGNIRLAWWGGEREIRGAPSLGGALRFENLYASAAMPYRLSRDGRYYYESYDEYARFTVVPAPVPLPAAAALLPLGIGALAMMRRRRRAVS